jgi:hypothetical protein
MAAESWDRLTDESPQAYAAALAYFKLGSNRSIGAAAKEIDRQRPGIKGASKGHQKASKGVKPGGNIRRWCKTHRWVERAAAWDANRVEADNRLQHEAMRAAADQEVKDWVERRRAYAARNWAFYEAAANRLARIVERDAKATPDGKVKPVDHDDYRQALSLYLDSKPLGREAIEMAAPLMPDSKGDQQKLQPVSLTTAEAAAAMRAVVEARRASNHQEKPL